MHNLPATIVGRRALSLARLKFIVVLCAEKFFCDAIKKVMLLPFYGCIFTISSFKIIF